LVYFCYILISNSEKRQLIKPQGLKFIMLQTILGVILVAFPFLLVFYFKNRLNGFVYILGASLGVHILVSFLTQFFHIFTYSIVVSIYLVIDLAILFFIKQKFSQISFKINLNWLAIFGFLIIFFELWSVHFFYTGTISTINGYQEAVRSSYSYPYFSDEWVGASLSSYSINNNTLPLVNSLALDRKDNNFPNIFVSFFSLTSELFLIFNIIPLLGYAYFSIATGLVICLLIFILLKTSGVRSFPSLIATMSVPFILNGANLPGIWYLLPFIGGLILFLLSLIGFTTKNNNFAGLMAVLAILLYPPMVVFILPTYLIYLLVESKLKQTVKIKKLLLSFGLIFLIFIAIVFSQTSRTRELFDIAISSIWRLSLDDGIPAYYFWRVIPLIVLPFSLVGLIKIIKQKKFIILTPVIVGVCFWLFYSFSSYYIVIDYARVVIITSILLVMLSGLGLQELINKLLNKYPLLSNRKIILSVKVYFLFLFLVLSFFYTNYSGWEKITLKINGSNYSLSPAAPANKYLTADDLELFREISHKRFLSPPWKGLVLGVATDNYPLNTKDSIVSTNFLYYNNFINETCENKASIAKKAHLAYVYSSEFNCDKFNLLGVSQENLYLYKFSQ